MDSFKNGQYSPDTDENTTNGNAFGLNDDLGLSEDDSLKQDSIQSTTISVGKHECISDKISSSNPYNSEDIPPSSNTMTILSQQNKEYETEILQLKEELKSVKEEITKSLVAENNRLREEKESFQNECKTNEDRIHQYQLKLEKANGIIKKANVMKQDYLKLKEQMAVKENEIKQLQEQLQSSHALDSSQQNDGNAIIQEKTSANLEELSILQKENEQLTMAVEHLNEENRGISIELTKEKESVSQLQKQLSQQSEELSKLHAEAEEFENRLIQEKSKVIADSNDVLNRIEDENQHLTISLTTITRELEACRAENDELEARLKKFNYSDSDLKERNRVNQNVIEDLNAEVEKHKRVEAELKALVDNGNTNYEELKKECEVRENELNQLRKEKQEHEQELEQLKKIESELNEEIEGLKMKCEEEKEENKQITEQLKDLKDQISKQQSLVEQFEEQENRIQQLKEEEENRKKKFILVKNKYDQELEEARDMIQQLEEKLTSNELVKQKEGEIMELQKKVEELENMVEKRDQDCELLEQVQKELEEKESQLKNDRNELSVLDTRFNDLQQRYNQLESQNNSLKMECENQLAEFKQKEEESKDAEVFLLKESNENLKILLNNAEKKYVHLTSMNTELQKRIDILEQQNHMRTEQISINMRGTSEKQSLLYDSHDSSTDSLSFFGNNDEPLNVKVRMVYNQLRRAFVRLSPDLQKIVGIYFIAIHILLFFAIVL